MDYVVGSVAALISGNVTPNRPKLIRRALTPTKHQSSPNVTPKSEFVEDRSIFLSPTQQKKKAIVKKSPKRIFQNPDLDNTEDCEGNTSVISPKAEKVKKHLQEELEFDEMSKNKSPDLKSSSRKLDQSTEDAPQNKKVKSTDVKLTNDSTPKKKKNKRNSDLNAIEKSSTDDTNEISVAEEVQMSKIDHVKSPKNKKQKRKSVTDVADILDEKTKDNSPRKRKMSQSSDTIENKLESIEPGETQNKKKKNKKKKNKATVQSNTADKLTQDDKLEDKENKLDSNQTKKQKNKKNKKSKSKQIIEEKNPSDVKQMEVDQDESEAESEEVKLSNIPNPNAITEKDSDSEHDSDNDIESENEESNKKVLTTKNQEPESSDEDEKPQEKNKKEKKTTVKQTEEISEDEIKRTLFVGNVPFSNKCKKEIKKMFNKYGQIETVRIRTIPVKDARVTPKLAIIKNELHPERTTVNVYVKFAEISSVFKALAENNTVFNGNHLRVTRSGSTGAEHDPHLGVFVGNLPFALEDDTLRSKFEKCGEIQSVRIVRDKKTNAGKGFGYVNFASKDGVELALALSEEDLTIKNRILRVKRCTQGQGKKGGNTEKQGKWNQRGSVQDKWNQRGGVQGKWNQKGGTQQGEGAYRRVMNKRKQQDGNTDGPPHKKQRNLHQPGAGAEKKPRKEFVGMTAEKKKKHKFNKGQKKKKALSEILSK